MEPRNGKHPHPIGRSAGPRIGRSAWFLYGRRRGQLRAVPVGAKGWGALAFAVALSTLLLVAVLPPLVRIHPALGAAGLVAGILLTVALTLGLTIAKGRRVDRVW